MSIFRCSFFFIGSLAGEGEGGYGGCNPPPFQISKIKESNKAKQKIEYNWKGRREKGLYVCLVFMCTCALIRVSTNIFLSKFSSSTPPPPFWKISASPPAYTKAPEKMKHSVYLHISDYDEWFDWRFKMEVSICSVHSLVHWQHYPRTGGGDYHFEDNIK